MMQLYMITNRAMSLLVLLVCYAATLNTVTGQALQGSSSYGKDFYLGFMKNYDGNSNELYLMITTTSRSAVSVTIETSHRNLQVNVSSAVPARVRFNHADEGPVQGSDFANRNKGIHVYTSGDKDVSVLVMNVISGGSAGEYLAYPYLDLGQESYDYYAVSTNSTGPESTLYSEILIVAQDNDTEVTITPTQSVVFPRDAQSADNSNITVNAGTSHVLTLHQRQTLLFNSVEDLSRTKITSNKPLTVVSGHECGNVPYNVRYCEHLAVQIPPTVTWGKTFLLAPFARRRSGQIYKAVTDDGTSSNILLSCNGQHKTIEFPYEFETNSDMFCFLNSSASIFLTQWSKGGVLDRIGDPTVSPVVPIEQYFNRVSFDSLPLTKFLFIYNYISITVPAEHYSSNSVLLDNSPIRCAWTTIRNAKNKIVGYGCTLQVPYGNHIISRSRNVEKLSVMVYGTHLYYYQAYAYTAGMELKAINLPRVIHFSPGSFPFYGLEVLPGVKKLPRSQDAVSDPIYIKPAMPLQFKFVGKAFVSENGVISFEKQWMYAQPERLPTNNTEIQKIDMVAPFWSDNDIRKSGTVRYVAIEVGSSFIGDFHLANMNNIIKEKGYPEFAGKYAIIAQWDRVHPFPHGNSSGYNISVDELAKTNTYQAVVVTNGIATIVQYTYMCDGMQWSKSGSKYAVVGINLHGRRTDNYAGSGFSSVDGVATCSNSHLTKRSSHGPGSDSVGGEIGNCTGNIYCLNCKQDELNACLCKELIIQDELMFTQHIIDNMANRIPSCPPSLTNGKMTDHRFIQHDAVENNCYIWAFYEEHNRNSFTKQCCYNGNSIIGGNTSRSGSLVAYHPSVDMKGYAREVDLKNYCCKNLSDQVCDRYFERRPNDNGTNYASPAGATVWGDPHYRLFGRQRDTFHFQGRERYVLMGVKQNDQLVFLIHAEHISCPHSRATCLKTLAFGLPNISLAYQFGGSKFEMYQTLGANDPNKLIISSANKTGDILWDKHGFLYKMTNNKIKAVFKIGSDAVSLTSTQYTSGKIKYLKLEIFLPLTKEFKKLNFTTFGLLGSHDDDFNNDFKYRNGTSHNRQFHGFNDWLIGDEDIDLFRPTAGRRRRQTHQAPILNADLLNYTAEHIALCGDDSACLFDFAVTGERDFAVTTIESGKNFTKTVETLKNFPPLIVGDETIRVELGQETTYNFTVEDLDGDNYTVNYATDQQLANISLTNDGNGNYSFKFTVYEQNNVTLAFTAKDSIGAAASHIPILEVCGCINGGNCTLQGLLIIDSTTIIMNCECPEAYTGQFCEHDTNGCSEIQCFDGVDCMDVQAPGVGAICGPCPTGYTGDGLKCIDINECLFGVCDQVCTNTDGSYSCSCKKGYMLQTDEIHCQDVDECLGVNDCQQECNNTIGSYMCSCLEGFTLDSDERSCTAQNPCLGGGECSHTCGLVNGVASCFCPVGYQLRKPENKTCVDKNECLLSPCDQICTNNNGSFSCSCRPGYRYIEEQNICADIDECEEAARDGFAQCVGNSKCINTQGSYSCPCFDGYIKINGTCQRQEIPVEVTPVIALPAEILANGIRITINNYNKENFTEMHKKSFIKFGHGFILFGYLINFMNEKLIPFPGASSFVIKVKIVDFTIRNNDEGKLTFLLYAQRLRGLIPGNVLGKIVQERKNNFLFVGFDIA